MSAVGDMIDAYCADTSVSGVCEFIRDLSGSMQRVAPMAARARSELQSAVSDVAPMAARAHSDVLAGVAQSATPSLTSHLLRAASNVAPTRWTSPVDLNASATYSSSTVVSIATGAPSDTPVASGAPSGTPVASGAPSGTPSTAPKTSDGAWLAALVVIGVLFALFSSGSSE
jgi:hypothetical protein